MIFISYKKSTIVSLGGDIGVLGSARLGWRIVGSEADLVTQVGRSILWIMAQLTLFLLTTVRQKPSHKAYSQSVWGC